MDEPILSPDAGDDAGTAARLVADDDLVARIEADFRAAEAHSARWRTRAREDYDFAAGAQWTDEEKSILAEQLRPAITFNRIGPVIDAVAGAEVQNRQEVRFVPRELGDAGINALYTGAAKWVRDECDAEDEESDAFVDLAICGMGWTETRMDYETDPDGMIRIDRIDPLEMWWDPAAAKRNLADARWVMRLRRMRRADVAALWPDRALDLAGDGGPWAGALDDRAASPHDADAARLYRSSAARPADGDRVTVAHYQYWERETVWRALDPLRGEVVPLTAAQHAVLRDRFAALGLPFRAIPQSRRVWRQAFLCGRTLLERGDAPCQLGFTLRAMTGKRDATHGTWYGLVRPMKDPQRWANKWLSQTLHILNANAKGGVIAETSAVENVRRFEETWADPSGVTWLAPGGLGKLQPKPPTQFPAGMSELIQFAVSSIRDVTGVNLELLGLADRNQPGILEDSRKQAGLTILATLFDGLRRYRKEQGRILLAFIQRYLSDGRLIRIEGTDGARYLPLLRDPDSVTYDVIVDQQPTSPAQRERVFAVLCQLLPTLIGAGIPVPPEIIDYTPLPEGLQARWKAMLTRPPAPPPPPDPKRPLELAKLQAEIARTGADAALKQAEADAQRVETAVDVASAGVLPLSARRDPLSRLPHMSLG